MSPVVRPPAPDTVRRQILALAADNRAGWRGVLFEPEGDGEVFRPIAATRDVSGIPHFSRQGALLRWLRVNDLCLAVPDAGGVCEQLPETEQRQLRDLDVCGCVPFVHEYDLVAWLALVGCTHASSETVLEITEALRAAWAARLHEARLAWHEQTRTEAVARSNRLTVAGQMAASIAHEIRNPLAGIRSAVQSIHEGDTPQREHPRMLATVLREIDRISITLASMLALGRGRSSQHEVGDVKAIADNVVAFCTAYARRRGIALESTGEAVLVNADPFELRQVLVNLVLNACQASYTGGRVRVETGVETSPDQSGSAVVRVLDDGAGIRPEDLPRAFEAFYSTKTDGGGLGLAICRDIVERHHGRIDLTSQMGHGTIVTIRLPSQSADVAYPGR